MIGSMGEARGLIIFPSFQGYERFMAASEGFARSSGPFDLGTSVLSLTFDRAVELPPSMRKEVMAQGWPVADPDAYPRVEHRERDGTPRPLTEKDIKIATACAYSFSALVIKHGERLDGDAREPICESWFDSDDLEVRFTLPFQAWPLFDANEPPKTVEEPVRAKTKVGRNDPCPCGSGRKYKKCCLGKEPTACPPGSANGSKPICKPGSPCWR